MKAPAILLLATWASAMAVPFEPENGVQSREVSDSHHSLDLIQSTDDTAIVEYRGIPVENTALVPRENVNLPGIGERITVALAVASITIIREARDKLRVEVNNLVDYAIKATIAWAGGSEVDRVPADATASFSANIGDNPGGQLSIRARGTWE